MEKINYIIYKIIKLLVIYWHNLVCLQINTSKNKFDREFNMLITLKIKFKKMFPIHVIIKRLLKKTK